MNPDMTQFNQLLDSLAAIALLVFPVIGLTGGVKGAFKLALDKLPDLTLGPWIIKDGVWLSWLVAAILLVLGNVAGWLPGMPDFVTSPQAWALFQWSTLALLANMVRNWAGISGGSTT